jgi:hypothetical protein
MSDNGSPNILLLLEAYLDGSMPDADRQAFEKRITHDVNLRLQLVTQSRIDETLRRRFAPPAADRLIAKIRSRRFEARIKESTDSTEVAPPSTQSKSAPAESKSVRLPRRRVALAASLAILVAAGLTFRAWIDPGQDQLDGYVSRPPQTFESIYADVVAAGLKPDWVCKDDAEFIATFTNRLGAPLLLADAPPNVHSIGLYYGNTISPFTTCLLARVDQEPVVVFIDLAERDKGQSLPPETNLQLHHRALGPYTLYELSPLPQPGVLKHFILP